MSRLSHHLTVLTPFGALSTASAGARKVQDASIRDELMHTAVSPQVMSLSRITDTKSGTV